MSWDSKLLGEVVDLTQGFCINKKSNHLVVDEGIPLLRITDMINSQQKIFISPESPKKFIANKDDIIFTRTGQVGLVFRNQYGIIHNNCFKVSPLNQELSKDYLYWFLRSEETITKAKGLAAGAAQPDLNHGAFKSISITYPKSLQTQKRIADILSAYDDLIENNLKRIKLLEQVAQNIYREWFVNLRFPGHENTPINEETGLPEGWKEVLAKEYFDFKRGIEVGSKNYVSEESDNTIPFLRVGSLGSRDQEVFTDISLVKDRILNFEDVCISMDGSIGLVGYGLIGAYSTGLRKIVAKSNKYSTGFIYGLLKSEEIQDTIRAYAKGSTILHASSSIEHLKFNDANEEISTQFNKVIDPIYSKLLNLKKQNQKLIEARDILLPRLMNRTIEV